MKIGVLTFHNVPNFGAFLQTYALQRAIKDMGHEVSIINLKLPKKHMNLAGKLVYAINNRSFQTYRKLFLSETPKSDRFSEMTDLGFDFYIVGSDQVWNKNITKNNYLNYFFDFLPNELPRISYAASFGLKEWNFSPEETAQIQKLINQFNGISVREDTGSRLCKENLGVDSNVVLDPTLLLTNYDELINNKTSISIESDSITCFKFSRGDSFYKFAKQMKIKGHLINELRGVNPFRGSETNKIPFPTIGTWLYYIKYSPYILTDSFHGVCLSIIFKKKFIVIPADITKFNRISDLLMKLGLNNRIFYSYDEIINDFRWKEEIDYDAVDRLLKSMRSTSISFLKQWL